MDPRDSPLPGRHSAQQVPDGRREDGSVFRPLGASRRRDMEVLAARPLLSAEGGREGELNRALGCRKMNMN